MSTIHEVATITSKGQITLPKPMRQALGVKPGGKVAIALIGSQLVITRMDDEFHEDPAIAGFLAVLEHGIQSGQQVAALSDDLARSMLEAIGKPGQPIDLNEDIVGDVAL